MEFNQQEIEEKLSPKDLEVLEILAQADMAIRGRYIRQ